jgi:hypothetical protein
MEHLPEPFGVAKETTAVMSLDDRPVNSGPAGAVGTVWLRVVPATRQIPGFTGGLKINSMLIGGG